jgi:hypothetical protein
MYASTTGRKLRTCYVLFFKSLRTIVSLLLYVFRDVICIYSQFTHEESVLDGCDEFWVDGMLDVLAVGSSLYGDSRHNRRTTVGAQWISGVAVVVCLWCVSFPGIVYFAIVQYRNSTNDEDEDGDENGDGGENGDEDGNHGGLWVALSWVGRPSIFLQENGVNGSVAVSKSGIIPSSSRQGGGGGHDHDDMMLYCQDHDANDVGADE